MQSAHSFGPISTNDTFTNLGVMFPESSYRQDSEGLSMAHNNTSVGVGSPGSTNNMTSSIGIAESNQLDGLIDGVISALFNKQQEAERERGDNGKLGNRPVGNSSSLSPIDSSSKDSNGGTYKNENGITKTDGNGKGGGNDSNNVVNDLGHQNNDKLMSESAVKKLLRAVITTKVNAPSPKPMHFKPGQFVPGDTSSQSRNWSLTNLYANTRQSSISQDLLDVVSNEKAAAGDTREKIL